LLKELREEIFNSFVKNAKCSALVIFVMSEYDDKDIADLIMPLIRTDMSLVSLCAVKRSPEDRVQYFEKSTIMLHSNFKMAQKIIVAIERLIDDQQLTFQ
jgi:hypothetical protein